MVVRGGMEHERVQDDEVADFACHLFKFSALGYELTEGTGINAFWALMIHIGPEYNGEQGLFSAVEKMTEVTAIFVPADSLR